MMQYQFLSWPCDTQRLHVRCAGRDSMATTVWLALTLWLVMMIGELGVVTQSASCCSPLADSSLQRRPCCHSLLASSAF